MNTRLIVIFALLGLALSQNSEGPTLIGAVTIPFNPSVAFQSGTNQYFANYENQWGWFTTGGKAGGGLITGPCPKASNYFVNDTGAIFCVNPSNTTIFQLNGEFSVVNSWSYTAPLNASNVQYSIKSNLFTILSMTNAEITQFQVFNTATLSVSCTATVNLTALPVTGTFGGICPTPNGILFGIYDEGNSQRSYYQAACGATNATIFTQATNTDDNYQEVDIIGFNKSSNFLSVRTDGTLFSLATFTAAGNYKEFQQDTEIPDGQWYWRVNDTTFAIAMQQETEFDDFWNVTLFTWANATEVYPYAGVNWIEWESSWFAVNNASNGLVFGYTNDNSYNNNTDMFFFNYWTGSVTYAIGTGISDNGNKEFVPVFTNNGTIVTFTTNNVSVVSGNSSWIAPFVSSSFNTDPNGPHTYFFQNEGAGCQLFVVNSNNNTWNWVNYTDCTSCAYYNTLGDVTWTNGQYGVTYQCDDDVHMLYNNTDFELSSDAFQGRPGLIFANYENTSAQVVYVEPLDGTTNLFGGVITQYGAYRTGDYSETYISSQGLAYKLNQNFALIVNTSSTSTSLAIWNVNAENWESTPITFALGNVTDCTPIGVNWETPGAVPTIDQYIVNVASPTNYSSLWSFNTYLVSSSGVVSPFSPPFPIGQAWGWNYTLGYGVHNAEAYFVNINSVGMQIGQYNITPSVTPASGAILGFSGLIALLLMIFAW